MIPEYWQWFPAARFGLFIHWGPYAVYARGEQVLNREHLDHDEYAAVACQWNPTGFDAAAWAAAAKRAGLKYAVFTTRHHDGYCLWDTKFTDYSSACQAPQRDFVREFVTAFRAAGIRVGLYYSLIDFRVPAWFEGPARNPAGWQTIRQYIFDQVEELLTGYGDIDVLWFDGLWPWSAAELGGREMIAMARRLQPHILVNDRLEWPQFSWNWQHSEASDVPKEKELGDFGTPEQGIYTRPGYLWESCQVSTWRLWGYAAGEHWRSAAELLDTLVECTSRGGNLLLNVGPQPDGRLPAEFTARTDAIGEWLAIHGEAIYGTTAGNVTEFITRGWQTVKDHQLYLIMRFWDGRSELRLPDLLSPVTRVTLLTSGQDLPFEQQGETLWIRGLPAAPPSPLFPVIRLTCSEPPRGGLWAQQRTWQGDPERFAVWAARRGASVWTDGRERAAAWQQLEAGPKGA